MWKVFFDESFQKELFLIFFCFNFPFFLLFCVFRSLNCIFNIIMLDLQKKKTYKSKSLSPYLKEKLIRLISQSSSEHICWLKVNHKFAIMDAFSIEGNLRNVFEMSFRSFKKFMKIVGFKIYKKPTRTIFVCPPSVPQIPLIQSIEIPKKQHFNNEGKSNLEEISLEMSLLKKEQIERNEEENQEKLCKGSLLKFKQNVQISNKLLDEVILKVILAYGNKEKVDEKELEQILNKITESQDYMFDNEKELENCIEFFRHKVQSNQMKEKEQIPNEPIVKNQIQSSLLFKFSE